MATYHIADRFGYGKIINRDDDVLPEAEHPCRFFFWKDIPLFYVEEYTVNSETGRNETHSYEFFSGIEINLPSDEFGLHDGVYVYGFGRKQLPVLEFQKRVNCLSEDKKRKIADKMREFSAAAHDEYLKDKQLEVARLKQIEDAKHGLKRGMY